jgi:hypothetical protein
MTKRLRTLLINYNNLLPQVNSNTNMSDEWETYTWKDRVAGEPIDICRTTVWVSDFNTDRCKVCKMSNYVMYEITLEWGDTKCYEYISEVCSRCMDQLASKSRNAKDVEYR